MSTLGSGSGPRVLGAVLLTAVLAGAAPGSAAAASATAGAGGATVVDRLSRLMEAEAAAPSANPEMARRQALGCTLVGLGVTGVAVASGAPGALAAAGSAASGLVPVGAAVGEILTYFGAGCTIGAFLAGLFPVHPPVLDDIGG